MQLSEHFSLEELTATQQRGVDNTPTEDVLHNLRYLAQCLEDVRDLLGVPVHVTSGFRCAALNAIVGGARLSDHVDGLAGDLIAPLFGTPYAVAKAIAESRIEFHQLILEFDRWTHISFHHGAPARREVLTIRKPGIYLPGLIER